MITKVNSSKDEDREWFLVDASQAKLGRLSAEVVNLLRGKNKPNFSPNMDCGDNVIVINAEKTSVSRESKKDQKTYYRHSGYPGNLKERSFREMINKHPERPIELAVKGMMPKNKLSKKQLKRLKIYPGANHPHTQELIKYELKK